MYRLNLGCGSHRLRDWVNVDMPGHKADMEFDLSVARWPIESNSVREVNMGHVLEHFDKAAGYHVLRQAYRIMIRTGTLTLAVPDTDKFIAAHLSGDFSALGGYQWTSLNDMAGGGKQETDPFNRHRQLYCFESLAYMLIVSGFENAKRREFNPAIDNPQYAPISLYMEATR